jgi:hypothetical protein
VSLGGMAVRIGLPPPVAMFNNSGTAYAASSARAAATPIESRFVLWFNGNGIVENYWVPRETGADYNMTPCLRPLEPFRKDIHIITGLDKSQRERPSRRDELADVGRSLHRTRRGRAVDRSKNGPPRPASEHPPVAERRGRQNSFTPLKNILNPRSSNRLPPNHSPRRPQFRTPPVYCEGR